MGGALWLLGHASPAVATPAKILDESASDRTETLVQGQPLRIRLSECASCGYMWSTVQAPNRRVLRRQKQRTESTCKSPCVGGMDTRIFRYVARRPGSTRLRLQYLGPADPTPLEEFHLRVRVTARP